MAEIVQAPIAVTSGAYTAIRASTFARYVEIAEDGSATAGGIQVQWPNGNVSIYSPAMQPVVIGSKAGALGAGTGPLLGTPPSYQSNSSGTLYCNVKSVGATSAIRVSEWN